MQRTNERRPMSCTLSLRRAALCALAVAVLATQSSSAFAHVGTHASGFTAGVAHPLSGLDHVLAMVAVGVWAAQLGRPAVWLLPLAFPAVMALGAVAGASGIALPALEIALAGTVLALGLAIACALRPSLAASIGLIAAFALIHGYSHGAELPVSSAALTYGAGFVAATFVLHAIGLAIGGLPRHALATRTAGAVIAAAGLVLLVTA